jgi:hypothetical protein
MDVVHLCLSLTPVPYLSPAFSAFRFICSSIAQAKASKLQLEALAQSIAQFLKTLDGEYRAGRLAQGGTSTSLVGLHRFVEFVTSCILSYTSITQTP